MGQILECSFFKRIYTLPIKDFRSWDEKIKVHTDQHVLDIDFGELDYIQLILYSWYGSSCLHSFIMSVIDREEGEEIYPLSEKQIKKIYETFSRALLAKDLSLLGATDFVENSEYYQVWCWDTLRKVVSQLKVNLKKIEGAKTTFYYKAAWVN
jgi:hypothetical protein